MSSNPLRTSKSAQGNRQAATRAKRLEQIRVKADKKEKDK